MRILVTRPIDDARDTAAELERRGHTALLAPLLTVEFDDDIPLYFDHVQAIIATSANGVRALARRTSLRELRIYAVGPQTAAEARRMGFCTVHDADGDASDLVAAIVGWASKSGGRLLHVTGKDGAGHVTPALDSLGFKVETAVLYKTVPVRTLPAAATKPFDAILVFSPRSAAIYAGLAVPESAEGHIAVCISQKTADALMPLRFKEVRVAARPNQEALLACL